MCEEITQVHLKIEARPKEFPESAEPKMEQYKTVMFPSQHELKNLDPDGSRPVEELRIILQEMKDQYLDLIGKKYDPERKIE